MKHLSDQQINALRKNIRPNIGIALHSLLFARAVEAEVLRLNGIGEAQTAREWVGLDDGEIIQLMPDDGRDLTMGRLMTYARAIEANLREKNAGQPAADANAPWLTEAHMICTDHGIPHGHIVERIKALRAKLADDKAVEPVATVIKKGADRQWVSECLGSLPDGIYSLYTTPPTPAVPEGYKIVPVVPTEEMIEAGRWEDGEHTAKAVYRAMLSAAPQPEKAG